MKGPVVNGTQQWCVGCPGEWDLGDIDCRTCINFRCLCLGFRYWLSSILGRTLLTAIAGRIYFSPLRLSLIRILALILFRGSLRRHACSPPHVIQSRRRNAQFCFALVAVVTGSAAADLVNPLVPDWRGDANTEYYGWDTFSQSFGAPNFPNTPPGNFNAGLYNFQSGAQISNSGNLYGAAGLNIHIYTSSEDPAPAPVQAVMNVTTMGSLISLDSVNAYLGAPMGGGDYFAPVASELRANQPMGEMGALQTWAFTFDLSGWQGGDTTWGFLFKGLDPHISLDAVSLDLNFNVVPAPGALALFGLAGIRTRRRR